MVLLVKRGQLLVNGLADFVLVFDSPIIGGRCTEATFIDQTKVHRLLREFIGVILTRVPPIDARVLSSGTHAPSPAWVAPSLYSSGEGLVSLVCCCPNKRLKLAARVD